MDKNSVSDVLRGLAEGDKARSETARLRDVVDEVEAALAAGVSRAAILEALHSQGFTMTLKSFESALYRIRRQRKKAEEKAPQKKAETPIERQKEGAAESEQKPESGSTDKSAKFQKQKTKRFDHDPNRDVSDLLK
ncbi:hypothetical protein [Halomonas hibernica]|uniref:hypothetical protein n=1 Tax=Halomonas hibernica TaxID=2591147 RepID=UPI001C130A62|nr:hypothetical protein [Halomonas hibernica]